MKHLEIIVHGTVQGVGFRYFTKKHADLIGIRGFVRNELNGDVFVYAHGEETAMKDFIAQLEKGPRFAFVRKVTIIEPEQEKHFSTFEIEV